MYRVAGTLLAASIIRYLGQLISFALLARLLGPTEAGTYALAIAVTAPVFILAGLGMRSVYLTLQNSVPVASFESLRTITVVLAVGVSTSLALAFQPDYALVIALVAASKAVDAHNDLYGAVLQKASRANLTVWTSVVCAVAQAGVLGVSIVFNASLAMALLASLFAYALATLLFVRRITLGTASYRRANAVRMRRGWQWAGLVRPGFPIGISSRDRPWVLIARAGLPTGISFGLITLLSTLPQYFLGAIVGPEESGRYATLMYLVVAAEMILNALAQSWIPHGRRLYEEGKLSPREVLESAAKWTLITVPVSTLAILVASVAFPLLLGQTFAIVADDLWPLGFAILVTPFVFSTATSLSIQNKYRFALVVSAVAVLLGVILGWNLVHWYGLRGGLWTYAICLVVRAVGGLAFVWNGRTIRKAT